VRLLQMPLAILSVLLMLNVARWVFLWADSHLLWLGTSILLLVAAGKAARSFAYPWREAAGLALCVLALRVVLLDNPVAWGWYSRVLSRDSIGRRQYNTVLEEDRQRRLRKSDVKYLAAGSSQTGAIYRHYRDTHPSLEMLIMPGMKPFDLLQYRAYCADHAPVTILLYLSEFDLAGPPALGARELCPRQGAAGIESYLRVGFGPRRNGTRRLLAECITGEFLPEYKYAFVFRGLLDTYVLPSRAPRRRGRRNTLTALAAKAEDAPRTLTGPRDGSLESLREYQIGRLKKNEWSEEDLAFNMAFLDMFLRFCCRRGIPVAIIGGQYHPDGYTEENLQFAAIVQRELAQMSGNYGNVQYIPRSDIMEFTASDFVDGYHVNQRAGDEFAARVVALLEERHKDARAGTPPGP
jgi:hypothetical protein